MKKFAQLSAVSALSAVVFHATSALGAAEPLSPVGPWATHECPATAMAGRTFVVSGVLTFQETLAELSWSPVLPAGWTVGSISGNGDPVLLGAQGPIVWRAPQSERLLINISYLVHVPPNAVPGPYEVRGQVLYRFAEVYPPHEPDPEPSTPTVLSALPDPLVINVVPVWTLWWQHSCGTPAVWSMTGTRLVKTSYLNCGQVDPLWRLASVADINGDKRMELRWQHQDGRLATWFMDGTNLLSVAYLNPNHVDPHWRLVASADIDRNGNADILWQNANGSIAAWFMNGTNCVGVGHFIPDNTDPSWKLVGTGHFNSSVDLLWQRTDGSLAVWFMDGLKRTGSARLTPAQVDPNWKVAGTYDLNGDNHTEIVWRHTNGRIAYWIMDGTTRIATGSLSTDTVDPNWQICGPR